MTPRPSASGRAGGDGDGFDVTVVLPVYNEVGHVVEEIERIRAGLAASPYSFEIIVVDDGSTDGSAERLDAVEGVRLIRFQQNRGKGSALKAGTRQARSPVVVWTDADFTYPNDEIARLVGELDGHDQVVGWRTSEQGTKKVLRVPAKWLLRKLASYLLETAIPDLNSGLRVFRRDVALQFLHLIPKRFSDVTTLTMTFVANGYSVHHVPIDYFPRRGRSKFHWWSDSRRYLLQILRMVLMYNPLKVFMPVGLVALFVGAGKLVFDLATKDFRVATNTIVVLLTALVVIMVGLLSDLVVQLTKPRDEVEPAALRRH